MTEEEQLQNSFSNFVTNLINSIKRGMAVIDGTVKAGSVDLTKYVCDVEIKTSGVNEAAGTLTINSVPLRVLQNAKSSFIEIPEDTAGKESKVLICFRAGDFNLPQILEVDSCKKIIVEIGGSKLEIDDANGFIFNNGSNGGLTNTPTLRTELNKTNALLNAILAVINGPSLPQPPNTPDVLQAALKVAISGQQLGNYTQIEDTKIKH